MLRAAATVKVNEKQALPAGVEPATSRLTAVRSNLLSYGSQVGDSSVVQTVYDYPINFPTTLPRAPQPNVPNVAA